MTNIAVSRKADVISLTAQSLGFSAEGNDPTCLSNPLIAQSLRRAAFIAAPCSARILREFVWKALEPLAEDAQSLKTKIDEVLEDLIATGDLLEMSLDASLEGNSVLRPAPPAFVIRRDGTIVVLGVAGDEITPAVEEKIIHNASGLRTLSPIDTQACRIKLLNLGLIELSDKIWLHTPSPISASEYKNSWIAKLPKDAAPEKLDEIDILDSASTSDFYKARWKPLSERHSGIYIARRPQRYGAKLWSLMEVHNGVVQRFTDIHSKDSRYRACDEAWRLQAAFDVIAGSPQKVRIEANCHMTRLLFSYPLPAWAVRRLSIIGEKINTPQSLLVFELPSNNMEEEIRWLNEILWLERAEGGNQ